MSLRPRLRYHGNTEATQQYCARLERRVGEERARGRRGGSVPVVFQSQLNASEELEMFPVHLSGRRQRRREELHQQQAPFNYHHHSPPPLYHFLPESSLKKESDLYFKFPHFCLSTAANIEQQTTSASADADAYLPSDRMQKLIALTNRVCLQQIKNTSRNRRALYNSAFLTRCRAKLKALTRSSPTTC